MTLDSVRFARSLYDGKDVLPCIDILLSNELARVSVERRPVVKELEVVATMFHIEVRPVIGGSSLEFAALLVVPPTVYHHQLPTNFTIDIQKVARY